ncbi:MAG: (2Fe-2S)-binding protein, partial [Syntrophales bacterium LBB04]|nr:(2Fe-2S)-binding protein [Syntrophales bacterium LBB04]
ADYLGGVPDEKMHCSVMGYEALENAVHNYKGRQEPARPQENIICRCFDVSEEKIRKVAVENHLTTVDEIIHYTKAGGGCGQCIHEIENILKDAWAKEAKDKPAPRRKLTNIQKMALIQDVLEKEIRANLRTDGGDLDLIDIIGNRVIVGLRGLCIDCPMGSMTLKGIADRLSEVTGEEIEVVAE